MLAEAFKNKTQEIVGTKWIGTTSDGLKIEMYIVASGINTAYLIQ